MQWRGGNNENVVTDIPDMRQLRDMSIQHQLMCQRHTLILENHAGLSQQITTVENLTRDFSEFRQMYWFLMDIPKAISDEIQGNWLKSLFEKTCIIL